MTKHIEYKVKAVKTGEEFTVKNDGFHYRAYDKEGLQKSNPWTKLGSLLDELGADMVREMEPAATKEVAPGEPELMDGAEIPAEKDAAPVGGEQGKAANTQAEFDKK